MCTNEEYWINESPHVSKLLGMWTIHAHTKCGVNVLSTVKSKNFEKTRCEMSRSRMSVILMSVSEWTIVAHIVHHILFYGAKLFGAFFMIAHWPSPKCQRNKNHWLHFLRWAPLYDLILSIRFAVLSFYLFVCLADDRQSAAGIHSIHGAR